MTREEQIKLIERHVLALSELMCSEDGCGTISASDYGLCLDSIRSAIEFIYPLTRNAASPRIFSSDDQSRPAETR